MKWFWWITGAVLFLALKNPYGNDSGGMMLLQLGVLGVFTWLGQHAANKAKRREQEERDRAAEALADELRAEEQAPAPADQAPTHAKE